MAHVPDTITVREAAERLGVTPRTLKYYEELGIVVPVRSEGRYRLYQAADLEKLSRVLRMRSLGFSLTTITAMIQKPFEPSEDGGRPRLSNASLKELKETLVKQLDALDTRVAQVRRELKDAATMQAQLRRDIDYVERRLTGESLESVLEERRREQPAKAVLPATRKRPEK
ncbi:MerR family transcriptional regulator [Variovorax sp. J2P1-59]|uniref:MerR family transcriptional regulator n=1 Tax=Variovorax flavidus TaxID=3053501 RepID=UPI002577C03E|nr:MerR family transcriptional regulator [Variovorax sp. J2P1-59]MDM0075619.1 MerR family transcriptional regulator [Variovorax sp. J2P1-59]